MANPNKDIERQKATTERTLKKVPKPTKPRIKGMKVKERQKTEGQKGREKHKHKRNPVKLRTTKRTKLRPDWTKQKSIVTRKMTRME